ncbi:hypothetical protein HDC91_003515 [Mucilaginibacter sp. AK015]|nr:hypothetical protein [Mucilaginibacter sp. AK015]
MFEYYYSKPHHITERSAIVALSAYAFSLAFSTKFRIISLLNIIIAFLAGIMYGSIENELVVDWTSLPTVLIYILVLSAMGERYHRHINENEICWFYTIFEAKK